MISDFISTVTCLFYLNHMHAEYAAFLKTVSCPSPQQAAGYSLKINELSKQPPEDMRALAEYVVKGTKLSDAKELLESRKSFQSSSPVDSPPLPKKHKSLEKLERHLGQAIKILDMMETASLPDNLDELLAISQEIQPTFRTNDFNAS